MSKKQSNVVPDQHFDQAELDRATDALDRLFQDHKFPKERARLNRNNLIEQLRGLGVTRALGLALCEHLIRKRVFRRGKKFVRLHIFVNFAGEQWDESFPNEYLHTTATGWFNYIAEQRLAWNSAGTTQSDKVPITPIPAAESPSGAVKLFRKAEAPLVHDHPQHRLTTARYNVLLALCNAGDEGLTKDSLVNSSGHGDARGVLTRLAKSSPVWHSVILMPGSNGSRYRLI